MKTLAFFNNKGGVGKTTLVYHLAWMFAELGLSVLAADLDPQANLTSMFLSEDELEDIWEEDGSSRTVTGCLAPLMEGTGDIAEPYIAPITPQIGLIVGDLSLSSVEDELSNQWPDCLDRKARAFRVITAFWRMLEMGASQQNADVVLIDVAPSLGALNRSALISASHVVIPLVPDLYSIQGLKNLGPTLKAWREEWGERLERNPIPTLSMPEGRMTPVGYVVLQHAVRLDRPVKAYQRWLERVPSVYRRSVLAETPSKGSIEATPDNDPNCLAQLKHYRSLMPLAQEARKPMFLLTPADGALGGHFQAAQACRKEFRALASALAGRCSIPLP
ncbi:AAA family ATPase [Cyanobium sp. FGCU-6]|nr:AAA family ATPase [Cyanobium sp. FGCU6]